MKNGEDDRYIMERFYTLTDFACDFYDANSRKSKFNGNTAGELTEWIPEARAVLSDITGLELLKDYFAARDFGTPKPEVVEAYEDGDFTRSKIYLQIEHNMTVPLYLFMPKDMAQGERRPVVLAPHGHGGGGKYAPAGITGRHEAVDRKIHDLDYNYGERFARLGYIVICPDAPGFGERREKIWQDDRHIGNASCEIISHMVYSLGLSMQGLFTYNLMRVADYALTLEGADRDKLYCAGLSGGGLQTLIFAACDTRVKKSIISGYFYGVKEALLMQPENCACNFSHRLWYHFDMGDIACMIYPRAFLVETGDIDPLNGRSGAANAVSQIEIARRAYALGNRQDSVVHHIYEGPHKWFGYHAEGFLKGEH
ncbi:MAG: alpha/beta hydrolase family protein [Eubacteriales bacterium]|nr:alpha/beta hydrolase family protein [Eubacteriales bacterium]